MTQVGLTERQEQVLEQLRLGVQNGRVPSYAEIASGIGLKSRSKSTVQRHITALEDRGYVKRVPGKTRAIELIDGPWQLDPGVAVALKVYAENTNRRPGDIVTEALRLYLRQAPDA